MKLIQKLKHNATDMKDSIFGWDFYKFGDYSVLDSSDRNITSLQVLKSRLKIGYAIIFAINIGSIRFFKRLFIEF